MDTIDQLKQQAREREEEERALLEQQERDQISETARRYNSLTDYLRSTEPYSTLAANARMVVSEDRGNDLRVTFTLPDHANLLARFVWEKHFEKEQEPSWHHNGFDSTHGVEYRYQSPDPKKMWRVDSFAGVERFANDEAFCPRYTSTYFADLGDALLAADRGFVAPEYIEDEVADMNAKRAPRAANDTAPEPTPDEILLDALKQWVRPLIADLVAEYQS